MTKKEVKRFLNCAIYAKREIERLERKIIRLKAVRERITHCYSGVIGGGSYDRITDTTAEIIELEERQRTAIRKYCQQYHNIEQAISSIESIDMRLTEILRLRYLEGERWEQIACDAKISHGVPLNIRWVYRLHNRAIKILADT